LVIYRRLVRTPAMVTTILGLALAPVVINATAAPPICRGSALRLSLHRGGISPETGEHATPFDLRNVGAATCSLRGYPRVRLFDRRGAMPFRYERGGRYFFIDESPKTVLLRPGARASFVVAQYRCDVGVRSGATRVVVYPPGTTHPQSRHVPAKAFSYCKGYHGHDRRDPGNTIHIGPVRRPLS
jgi:hypothetical protein